MLPCRFQGLTSSGSSPSRRALGTNTRSAILVLLATHRAALITMQPRPISPKGDKVSERELVIVKISDHRREASVIELAPSGATAV